MLGSCWNYWTMGDIKLILNVTIDGKYCFWSTCLAVLNGFQNGRIHPFLHLWNKHLRIEPAKLMSSWSNCFWTRDTKCKNILFCFLFVITYFMFIVFKQCIVDYLFKTFTVPNLNAVHISPYQYHLPMRKGWAPWDIN